MEYEGLVPSSSEDASLLLVPSLREIIQSLDKHSLQQLQGSLLLQPIVQSPTLIQVAC